MSAPDFRVDPLGHVFWQLASIEAELSSARAPQSAYMRAVHVREALGLVRALEDLIRPTLGDLA